MSLPKGKRLSLTISDKAYVELKNSVGLKKVTGNLYGIIDGLALRIIQAIEDESPDVTIMMKEEAPK